MANKKVELQVWFERDTHTWPSQLRIAEKGTTQRYIRPDGTIGGISKQEWNGQRAKLMGARQWAKFCSLTVEQRASRPWTVKLPEKVWNAANQPA